MRDLFEQEAQASQKKTLRPHQVRSIDLIRQSLGLGNLRVVLQGPVGFGKTLVAARIIEGALAKGNRVIFTAPAVSLIDQTVAAFRAEGIEDIGVMQANHPLTNSLARVQVATVQTLAKRQIPDASLVLIDEAHIRAEVLDDLMMAHDGNKAVRFVGLSATPWRKGMGRVWQDLVIPITVKELIDGGFLSQFTAFAPDVPDLSGVKVSKGEYVESQLAELMGEAKLVGHVVENWLANGQNRPTLCFGVNCNHAQEMAASFERAGVASAYVDAFTDTVQRGRINRKFRDGEIRVICSVRTMTTGVDLPVSCIVDAAPTKSEMLHIQKIGRGLRINPGTEDLVIFDHAGNLLRLGMPDEISYDRLDTSKPGEKQERKPSAEKLPKECANCAALHSGKTCPFCGHERVPYSGVEEAEGDLVQVKGKVKRATPEDKQRFYGMALWMADQRGYKPGWAANLYRKKMGVWPRGLNDRRVPADGDFLNFEKAQRIAFAKARAKGAEARA